jgi:YD repeat-containing protein
MGDKDTGDKSVIAAKDKAADKNTDTPSVKSSELMDKSALPILQQQRTPESSHLHKVEIFDSQKGDKTQSTPTADKSPKTHLIQRNETLGEIAQKAVGPNASAKEVSSFVDAIVKANSGNEAIKHKDLIFAGKHIILPESKEPKPKADSPVKLQNPVKPEQPVKSEGPAKPESQAKPENSPKPESQAKPESPTSPTNSGGDTQAAATGKGDRLPAAQKTDRLPTSGRTGTVDAPVTPGEKAPQISDGSKDSALRADAMAIRKATGNDNTIARWADREAINKILEGKSEDDRKRIDSIYKQLYKTSLDGEMSQFLKGSDLDKFRNILNRKDNNAENENARRIHQNLLEHKNTIEGRSNDQIEKDIRLTLASHTPEQIAKMSAEYKKEYGVSLEDALLKDDGLGASTKEIAAVYLDKSGKTPDQKTSALVDIALKHQDAQAFSEAMKNATPEARKAFLDNNGNKRIEEAFDHWYSGKDAKTAMDYAREGKLSTAAQVESNKHWINNTKGIELAIKQMTDQERKQYNDGKELAAGRPVKDLSPQDAQKAKTYYDNLHNKLTDTTNPTEVLRLENLISTKGKDSIVTQTATHRGAIYNDGMEKINTDIREMTKAQWDDAKAHPERREELKQMLGSLNKSEDEIKTSMAIYDRMMSGKDHNEGKDRAKESVLNGIDANKHWYGSNRDGVLDAVANMSVSEQDRYRKDAEFKKQVDESIKGAIPDLRGQAAATRMLDQVKAGKAPDSDVIANLDRIQNYDGSKTLDVVHAIDKAMRDDPTLRDRLVNPQTQADKELAAKFKEHTQFAFGLDYEQFGKPYVETGALSLEKKVNLSKGVFSDDTAQIYNDIKAATPQEKERLINDSAFQNKVLGFLGEDRKQVALAVAIQGEERPEDKIRSATVGWGGSADIVAALKEIKPDDLERVKVAYAEKYGASLEGDLTGKLGAKDMEEATRVLTQNLSLQSRVNIAKDQTENTRSGFGAAVADNVWGSGTGAQADETLLETTRALSEKNKVEQALAAGQTLAQNVTPEQQQAIKDKVNEALKSALELQNQATENHIEAKAAAADYVADGTIAAVAIGSLIVTGGADAPLLLALAGAGAAIKVGSKTALQGNDYDFSISQVSKDIAIGSITAATSAIGPGEIAMVFGVGKKAAQEASKAAIQEIGQAALREGGEKVIEDGTKEIVRNTLASGAKSLDQKDFVQLANKAISPDLTGAAREAAVMELAEKLNQQVAERMGEGVVRNFTQHSLNAAGGGIGGGAGGAVEGITDWDSRKSVAANLGKVITHVSEGAISGAIGGGVMSAGMQGVGHSYQSFKGHFARQAAGGVEDAQKVVVASTESAVVSQAATVKINEAGRVTQIDNVAGSTRVEYHGSGPLEGSVQTVSMPDGRRYTTSDGQSWQVTNKKGYRDTVQGKMTANADGTLTFKENSGAATVYRNDGTKLEVAQNNTSLIKDSTGKITGAIDNRGTTAKIEYATDGQVKAIHQGNGNTIQRIESAAGGKQETWSIKSDEHPEGTLIQGQSKLLKDGALQIKSESGATQILRTDGSRIEINEHNQITRTFDVRNRESTYQYGVDGKLNSVKQPDGNIASKLPLVERDADGRILSVSRPPMGNEIKISYEPTGVPGEVKQTIEFAHTKLSSKDGKTWMKEDPSAPEGSYEWKGKVTVAEDGTITTASTTGGPTTVHRPDGATLNYSKGELDSVNSVDGFYSRGKDGNWQFSRFDDVTPMDISGTITVKPEAVTLHRPDGTVKELSSTDTWYIQRGTSKDVIPSPVTISPDGQVSMPYDNSAVKLVNADGSIVIRENGDGKILARFNSDGTRVPKESLNVPDDPFHKTVEQNFKTISSERQMQDAVERVKGDLTEVRGLGADGKHTSVLDSLTNDTTLSAQQKENILRNLAEVRQHYAAYRAGDRMHPDSEINWIHTQGELGRVMQSARANNLTATQMEDAMLASMYSDSVKFAFPPPEGVQANFFTHHLDGAIQAREVLTRQGYPPERIDTIVQAIKEHQIAPPEFMGFLYYNSINGGIGAREAAGKITAQEATELRKTLSTMLGKDSQNRTVIRNIANVNEAPKIQTADGNWEVDFSPKEREVLKMAGIDKWSVPQDPTLSAEFKQLTVAEQNRRISQFKVAQTLIDGDAIDNYATLTGASKIVALRTPYPGSSFVDKTVWGSVKTIDDSFTDARAVLSPRGRELADEALAQRNQILEDKETGIRAQMDQWLRTKGKDPAAEPIPFYNADLTYPKPLEPEQQNMFKSGKDANGVKLTTEQMDALRYNGLTSAQIKDFEFAQEISAQMRDLLRKGGRLTGDLPGKFEPVTGTRPQGDWTDSKARSFEMPELTNKKTLSDGSWEAQSKEGTVLHRDGVTIITNSEKATTRVYDLNGRLTSASENGKGRTFEYDSDGQLISAKLTGGDKIHKSEDGKNWYHEKVENGTTENTLIEADHVYVDSDGSLRMVSDKKEQVTLDRMDGSRELHLRNGRVDYLAADISHEKARLDKLASETFTDPARLERFNKLRQNFDTEAFDRNLSINTRALTYKQINRLLADNPSAVLSRGDRADLAEQMLSHSSDLRSIDQGANSTCNVTTLENRNYARNPDKNVQIVADIAESGKFVTLSGQTVDMARLQAGIKPDGEATINLQLQRSGGNVLKRDGARDWSSQIVEVAILNSHWQTATTKILKGRQIEEANFAYSSDRKLIGAINKDNHITALYDANGKKLSGLAPDQTAYTKMGFEVAPKDRGKLIYDQFGNLKGMTEEQNLTKLYDPAGQPLTEVSPGVKGYDNEGNQIFHVAGPGETVYDKVGTAKRPISQERILYKDGDNWVPLKDYDGDVIDSPNIYTNELIKANREFSAVYDASHYVISNRHASSAKELGERLQKLKEENQLPVVLQVHTSKAPFSKFSGLQSAWGGGGWHVVNVQDYDAATGVIKFTNQWGSKNDFMDKGIPVEDLYKSLDATRLAQYFESHPTQRKVYQRSLIGAGYVGGIAGLLYAEKLGIEAYYERKDREQKEQRQREQRPPSEQNKPQVQVPIGRTN